MTHINVTLTNSMGDRMRGSARNDSESYPRVTVNGTCLYATTWEARGWSITWGDEE